MTVTKKAARASEAELLAAFGPFVEPPKGNAAFYGEAGGAKQYEFADTVAKMLNKWDRRRRSHRKQLLTELVNLHDPAKLPVLFQKTVRLFRIEPPPTDALGGTQRILQCIWRRDLESDKKQRIVQMLLSVAMSLRDHGGILAPLISQQLEFDPKNFLGQVVSGILENWPAMAKCENPECAVPYFLAKRTTQKYCERGECTRYALRKKAREHWRKKYGKSNEGSAASDAAARSSTGGAVASW